VKIVMLRHYFCTDMWPWCYSYSCLVACEYSVLV